MTQPPTPRITESEMLFGVLEALRPSTEVLSHVCMSILIGVAQSNALVHDEDKTELENAEISTENSTKFYLDLLKAHLRHTDLTLLLAQGAECAGYYAGKAARPGKELSVIKMMRHSVDITTLRHICATIDADSGDDREDRARRYHILLSQLLGPDEEELHGRAEAHMNGREFDPLATLPS